MDNPRVDGGPEDPSEVPLPGSGGTAANAAAVIGKVSAVILVSFLGLSPFLSDLFVRAAGILTIVCFALALNVYQRRAVR